MQGGLMKPVKREGRRHKFDRTGGEAKRHLEPAIVRKRSKVVHHIRRMPRH